jgi:hypothetical protein
MKTAKSGAEVSCIVSKRHTFSKVLCIVACNSGFVCDQYLVAKRSELYCVQEAHILTSSV